MTILNTLLLADGRFPTGGHAHSGGLEAAFARGLEIDEVPEFIEGRLRSAGSADAHLVVAARRAATAGDLAALGLLGQEAEARCTSPPLRLVARQLGSQLLRSARGVFPEAPLLHGYPAPGEPAPRPVAFGAVAGVAGLDDLDAARTYLYDDAVTVATAAVRLRPLDPVTAFRWVGSAGALIDELAAEAAACDAAPRELPTGFAPLLELGSLAHDRAERKLFAG
jgi:urease accessory protein